MRFEVLFIPFSFSAHLGHVTTKQEENTKAKQRILISFFFSLSARLVTQCRVQQTGFAFSLPFFMLIEILLTSFFLLLGAQGLDRYVVVVDY